MTASLSQCLAHIYPDLDFERGCILQDDADGNGPRIVAWNDPRPQPSAQQIADAQLPIAKEARIASINAECKSRLFARYGQPEEQVSRALGIYGQVERDAMQAGIAATVDASNIASNAVISAVDLAAVEAVTVTWPVI